MALIPTVTAFPLQQAFIPLLEALTAELPRQFPALIHSIYLYGSVARGEALPGVSDLDITLLLIKPADSGVLQRLEAWRQAFQLEQRLVSKVDFDIGCVDEALAPEHHDSWGFWLKHHCRCLWGEDVSAVFPLFQPDRRIALAVNADLYRVLTRYREQLLQQGRYRMRGA
ncbi:nucleotidyltransferase domain-containing protein [Serratia ureilytica]|uniref:nucleotidyltransferase domain-containing protein n=1 Tax=Serratia ureilytica TaxID=300181 RepID=UPI001E2AFA45|nr:nucleotidyltransferase domain-containing protein [Serratia ureilytica]